MAAHSVPLLARLSYLACDPLQRALWHFAPSYFCIAWKLDVLSVISVIFATLLSIIVVCDMSFECTWPHAPLLVNPPPASTLFPFHAHEPPAHPKSGRQVAQRPSTVLLIDACHLLAAGFFICNTRNKHSHTHSINPLMPHVPFTILLFDKWRTHIKRAQPRPGKKKLLEIATRNQPVANRGGRETGVEI